MDFIEDWARRKREQDVSEAQDWEKTRFVSEKLKADQNHNFQRVTAAMESAIVKLNERFKESRLRVIEKANSSFIVRREENPGLRITVKMEGNGTRLAIEQLSLYDGSVTNEESVSIRLDLTAKSDLIFWGWTEAGEQSVITMERVCELILDPVRRMLKIPD